MTEAYMAFWEAGPAVGSDRDCSLHLSDVCISVCRRALCPAALLKDTDTNNKETHYISVLHLSFLSSNRSGKKS